MKKIKYPLIAFGLVFLAYCKTSKKAETTPPAPVVVKPAFVPSGKQMDIAATRWPNTLPDEVMQGHEIYMTKCSKCHIAFEVTEFSEKKWIREIDAMAPKAFLTSAEKLKLTKHILSYREANAVVKPN